MRRLLLSLLALVLGLSSLSAQKPAMDHSVYDGWKSLSRCSVPWDGPWMFYTVSPQQGDGVLTVRNTVCPSCLSKLWEIKLCVCVLSCSVMSDSLQPHRL